MARRIASRAPRAARWACLLALLALTPAAAHGSATVVVLNGDGAGEGLNDSLPVAAAGGNGATTLGQARLQAVEFAASLWASSLTSDVVIEVVVRFDSLGGTPTSATLGFGGPESIYRDFLGAPLAATWYASALADKHAGLDMDGGPEADLAITFNSDVDGPYVMGSSAFYYGFDATPPDDDIDFLSVALHELAHGLGFGDYLNLSTGAKLLGYDDAFMRHLEHHGATPPDFPSMTDAERLAAFSAEPDLHWTGANGVAAAAALTAGASPEGHIEMYGPSPVNGSSLSHFSTSLEPDNFMEPFYLDVAQDFDLVLALFADIGWGAAPLCQGGTLP